MRVSLHAVGRMKAGPERDLAQRYLDRFAKAGPALGLDFGGLTEIAESRQSDADGRRREEAEALARHAEGSALVVLDERGRHMGSEEFARFIGALRDAGERQMTVALGGHDGHDETTRARARLVLSFGRLTWPHQLARIMLAEQLYRAATILSGHPYHRA